MKVAKFIAAAGLLLGAATMNAQNNVACLSKGNFAIGTRLGFSSATTNISVDAPNAVAASGGNTSTQISVTPTIGYFFARNFVVGMGMDYIANASRDNDAGTSAGTEKTSDSKLLFGPYARYYIPVADDQAFFIGAVSGFGNSDTQVQVNGDNQTVRTNLTNIGIGPGYSIFANNCISMDAQIKYNYGTSRNSVNVAGVTSTTRTNTNAWDFVVGFHYYFTRAAAGE